MSLGLDPDQLVTHVIRPTLKYIGWYSPAAEQLVLGTGITESRLRYLKQIGRGPALGIYQMEPATFRDIIANFLKYAPEKDLIEDLRDQRPTTQSIEVCYNLAYATAMCRAHYRRQKPALPRAGNAIGLAKYWKQWYNTKYGAGDVDIARIHFQEAVDITKRV